MKRLDILDVTLRDGGCVNNFNFGNYYMNKILNALENSLVEYVELGYIDEINGSHEGRTQYIDEKCIYHNFLKNKKANVKYLTMIDYGKFDINKLEQKNNFGIDGIRLCFHKKDRYKVIEYIERIIELGYECFIQPMLTLRYTKNELIKFINVINKKASKCSGVYIVDSFGEMRTNELLDLLNVFDKNLNPDIRIGFHSHNNLQLSYSNAIEFINFPTDRNLIIDSSIMGMGKGAGNLNTELLMDYLNTTRDCNYQIKPLLDVIDKVIKPLHNEYKWGYSIEYYLSSVNHCSPSYAAHFYNKHMLSINKINDLLTLIEEEKKISFDKNYAEELYRKYNENKTFNDLDSTNKLKIEFESKDILIIAPGKSINDYSDKICNIAKNKTIICLNDIPSFIKPDYILITREDVFYEYLPKEIKIIIPSNIYNKASKNIFVINYNSWIEEFDNNIYDSSGVFSIKLALSLKSNSISLAGFDGFSVNINSNYYSQKLKRDLSEIEAKKRNTFYKHFINKITNEITINFITPSIYQ